MKIKYYIPELLGRLYMHIDTNRAADAVTPFIFCAGDQTGSASNIKVFRDENPETLADQFKAHWSRHPGADFASLELDDAGKRHFTFYKNYYD